MTIAVTEIGSGEPVVLLHGCPVPPDHMHPLAESLARRYRVITLVSPGHAGTERLSGPYTLDRVRELMENALLARGIRQAVLVGHSLGGYQALEIARAGRIRVAKVACLAGFTNLSREERSVFAQFAAGVRAGLDLREVLVSRFLSPRFVQDHPEVADVVRGWWDRLPLPVVACELQALADLPERIHAEPVDASVLLRVGDADLACPPSHSELIRRSQLAGERADAFATTLEIVPGVGHLILSEDFAATAESLRRFVGGEAEAT